MNETNLSKRIIKAVGRALPWVRLFRNNVGTAWQGKQVKAIKGQTLRCVSSSGKPYTYTLTGRERIIVEPRPVDFGLFKGSGDYIGYESIEITPEMVGKTFARFISMEIKTPRGRVREDQENWRAVVIRFGGRAIVVRSPEEAVELLQQREIE